MGNINTNIIKDIKRIQEELQSIRFQMEQKFGDIRLMVMDLDTICRINTYLDFAIKYVESEGVDDGK